MTILDALLSVNSYPIPLRTIQECAQRHSISLDSECTVEVMQSKAYNLAYADLLMWLSFAPSVSQGGQSYSFTDEQRMRFRNRAQELMDEFAEDNEQNKTLYGYKGSRL